MAWKDVAEGACFDRAPIAQGAPSPGATLFVPVELAPGASKTIVLAWPGTWVDRICIPARSSRPRRSVIAPGTPDVFPASMP